MSATEWISLYRPGGYHPVELGDKFNNRYVVEHKLGHGGYSTVWLARDLQHEHKRLVALKIMMSDDEFTTHGPNGNHRCLVTEVLGPSLRNLAGGVDEF